MRSLLGMLQSEFARQIFTATEQTERDEHLTSEAILFFISRRHDVRNVKTPDKKIFKKIWKFAEIRRFTAPTNTKKFISFTSAQTKVTST